MKIAIAQLNYTIGDIDGNASKIIDSINKAKAQRADLVIFAEQAVSGTPAFDLLRKTTFLELCEDALVEIASCCDGIAAIVGLPILTRGELVLMMKQFEEDFQIFDTKAQNPPVGVPSTYNDRTRMVYQAARCGLRDFFLKNGYKKACIGLSGGIDSAVVASMVGWFSTDFSLPRSA